MTTPSYMQQLPDSAQHTTPNTLNSAKYWQWARDQLRSKGVPESNIDAFISHKSGHQCPARLPPAFINIDAPPSPLVPAPAAVTDEVWFGKCNHLAQQAAAAGEKDEDIVAALLQSYLAVTPATAPGVASERTILAKEIVFGARLLHAVASSSQSSDFTLPHTAVGTWPPERKSTLSRWYRVAAMAKAYPRASGGAGGQRNHAEILVRLVLYAYASSPDSMAPIRLWLIEGAGHVLYHLIDTLSCRHGWTCAQVDARLEVTLVHWDSAVKDFHKWAIPCATVLRGDVHKEIDARRDDPARLPLVLYFNYVCGGHRNSTPTYGQRGAESRLRAAAVSCKTILAGRPRAGLAVAFPTDNGGCESDGNVIRAFQRQGALRAVEFKTGDAATGIYVVVAPL